MHAADLRVELRPDVGERDLAAQVARGESNRVRREPAVCVDEAAHGLGRRHGTLLGERQVHAHVERRTRFRERHRVLERVAAGHQRSRGDDAVLVRRDHRPVHGFRQTEIVGVND